MARGTDKVLQPPRVKEGYPTFPIPDGGETEKELTRG